MKRTLIVLGIIAIFAFAYGVLLFEPVKAGCGGSTGCNMSQTSSQQTSETAAKPGQYTCPMHPEVIADKPGKCPKCGMTLVKVPGQSSDQPAMSGDMAAQCAQIAEEFSALQDHFEMMMKLSDVGFLAEAMVKHQEMMTQFANHLASHQRYCSKMASLTDDTRSSDDTPSRHQH